MKRVQFYLVANGSVGQNDPVNQQNTDQTPGKCKPGIVSPAGRKSDDKQERQQQYPDHLVDYKHYKDVSIGRFFHIEQPAADLQAGKFYKISCRKAQAPVQGQQPEIAQRINGKMPEHEGDIQTQAQDKVPVEQQGRQGGLHQLFTYLLLFQGGAEKETKQVIEIFGEGPPQYPDDDKQHHQRIEKQLLPFCMPSLRFGQVFHPGRFWFSVGPGCHQLPLAGYKGVQMNRL